MLQYKEQVQQLDCGLAVVQMIHYYFYDEWISIALLKSNVNYSAEGINILELTNLSEKFGFLIESYQGSFEQLTQINLNQPIISLIRNESFLHYIVIDKIKNDYVIYYDPISGRKKVSWNDFKKIYTGIIITATKTSYQSSKENQIIKLFQLDFIKESIWLSVVSIIIVALSFVATFYFKIVLDQIIPSQLKEQFIWITFFFILVFVIKMLMSLTKKWFIHHIELKYNAIFIQKYLDKINNVKWLKINQFNESMHLKNIDLLTKVISFKANYLFTSISQGFCLIFATAILLSLDSTIFFITLISSCLIIGTTILFQNHFKHLEKIAIENSINFQKSFLNIIASIDQYKINSIRHFLKNNFDEKLLKSIEISNKNFNYQSVYSFIISSIENIIPFVIVIISILQIWENHLSVGQLILFMSIFNFFIDPMKMFTSMLIEIPINKQYIDNLNAFFLSEEENKNLEGNQIDKIKEIKIEKINFSFVEGKPILKIPELLIDQNYHLVGQNGSGKSTLLKMIATLINVDGLSFNGKLIDFYNLENLRNQICYIANDEYIPSCTVYQYLTNNIKNKTDIFLESVEQYKLLDLFEKMNLQLSDHLDSNAKNLSAGQKQFLLLMKLFSGNYSLVLLDEAFENLDFNILEDLQKILKKRLQNNLVLEISHRKNYLFDAKELDCEQFK